MLKIQFTDHSREAIWVVERIYSIGSNPDNALVINDQSVSPVHAKLITLDDKLYLKDFDSSGGCYVNDKKINKKELRPGDTFRLGAVSIKVVDPRESLSQSTAAKIQPDGHWSLVSEGSWLAGQEFFITKDTTIVGRGSQCDIVISGTHLSRQHAEIKVLGNLLSVRDLSSANGTFINNERITQGIAKPGDIIRLDSYSFKVAGPINDHNLTHVCTTPTQKRLQPLRATDLVEKKWKTRPTSPGNRALEDNDFQTQVGLRALTFFLFVILLAAIGYLIYSLL